MKKITDLFTEWRAAERLSRRGDRKVLLVMKEDSFRAKMNLPLNILKVKRHSLSGWNYRLEGGITASQEPTHTSTAWCL